MSATLSCALPLPPSAACDAPAAADELVHPRLAYQLGPSIPAALLRRTVFRDRVVTDGPIAWIDEATGAVWPLWIPRRFALAVARLSPGAPPPPDLEPELARSLRGAGVLISGSALARADAEAAARLDAARAAFAAHGHVNVDGLVPPRVVGALGDYYRRLFAAGGHALGDEQCELRYGIHDEPVARYVHHQLARAIEHIAAEPVIASYAYVAGYRAGAALPRHVDRAQCELSVTLLVDFTPELEGASPWPLYLDVAGARVAVHQRVGDGLLYRGRVQPHWRAALADGCASTSMLLHYVRRDFTGSLR